MWRSLFAAPCVLLAFATAAQAQSARTWVSGVGDDVNPCSRTAPCKTFSGAFDKTAAGGEISVIDPGGFGALTITKSVTLDGIGNFAGITASGTNAITIDAAGATVTLRHLHLFAPGNGLSGVRILAAEQVILDDVTISGFADSGVAIATAADVSVFARGVSVFNAQDAAVLAAPTAGRVHATFVQSAFATAAFGVQAIGDAQITVADSVIQTMLTAGASADGAAASVNLDRVTLASNAYAMEALNGARVRMSKVTALTNTTITHTSGGGQVLTFVNNRIVGAATVCRNDGIVLMPASLPGANVGTAYSATLSSDGVGAQTYAIEAGVLPAGLALSGGVITGTPTSTGTSVVTIRATDADGCSGSATYSLAVDSALSTTVVAGTPNPAVVGATVTFTATVSGGGATPSGNVDFTADGAPIGSATLSGGAAEILLSGLSVGTHAIVATYGGDADHLGSTGSVGQTIDAAMTGSTGSTGASGDSGPSAGTGTTAGGFTLAASVDTSRPGKAGFGYYTLTLAPKDGFSGDVALACVESGVVCSFSPSSVNLERGAAKTTVTIDVTNATASLPRAQIYAALVMIGFALALRRRRALFVFAAVAVVSCTKPTLPVSVSVTIRATAPNTSAQTVNVNVQK